MINNALRILIRDHYISRLWAWIIAFGILLVLLGVTMLYEQAGMLEQMRFMLNPWNMRKLMIGVYVLSVIAIIVSFALTTLAWPRRLATEADKAVFTGEDRDALAGYSDSEQRALYMLKRMSRVESLVWNAASWPGFFGVVIYILTGSGMALFIYMAIAMVALFYHRPSLAPAEELVAAYLFRSAHPPDAGELQ